MRKNKKIILFVFFAAVFLSVFSGILAWFSLGAEASGSGNFIIYGNGYNHTGEFLADVVFVKTTAANWEGARSIQLLNSYNDRCFVFAGRFLCSPGARKELGAFNLANYRLIVLSRKNFTSYADGSSLHISIPQPLVYSEEAINKTENIIRSWLK